MANNPQGAAPSSAALRRGQASRFLLIYLIFGLGVIWATVIVFTLADRAAVLENTYGILDSLTGSVGAQTQRMFGELAVYLELTQAWFEDNPGEDPRTAPSLLATVATMRARSGPYLSFWYIDAQGHPREIAADATPLDIQLIDRDYVRAQLGPASRGFYIGNTVQSREDGEWILPVSFPLPRNDFGLQAILAVIELPLVLESWHKATALRSTTITLARRSGQVLAVYPLRPELVGQSMEDGELWQMHLRTENEGHARLANPAFESQPRITAWQSIEGFPLVITVSMDEAVAYHDSTDRAWRVFIVLGLVSLVIVYMGLRLMRTLATLAGWQAQLEHLARTDSLTGLHNRRYSLELAKAEFERAARYRQPLSCLMLDIDMFKAINDNWGHAKGDEVLRELGRVLRSELRKLDIAGRFGGEEFVLFLPQSDLEQAKVLASRLQLLVGSIRTESGPVRICVGIACWTEEAPLATLEKLIESADNALYRAKREGRNRVCFTHPEVGCIPGPSE